MTTTGRSPGEGRRGKTDERKQMGGGRIHLEKSSRFLRVVIKYLPEDEPYRNIYGEQVVIFLPNLLIADNDLKLVTVYKNMRNDNKVAEAKNDGSITSPNL